MSSSDRGGLADPAVFVADVMDLRPPEFVPEGMVAPAAMRRQTEEAMGLDEFREGPTPEQIREECEREFEAEFRRKLAEERAADRQQLETLARVLREDGEARQERLARKCMQLAMAVAERVVRDRIDRDPETIERVLRDAVSGIDAVGALVVFVHEADAAYLRAHEELLEEIGVIDVRVDPQQRRGGCRIELDESAWDASVIGQLGRLHEAIARVLEKDR